MIQTPWLPDMRHKQQTQVEYRNRKQLKAQSRIGIYFGHELCQYCVINENRAEITLFISEFLQNNKVECLDTKVNFQNEKMVQETQQTCKNHMENESQWDKFRNR